MTQTIPWEEWFQQLSRAKGYTYEEMSRMTVAQIYSALRDGPALGDRKRVPLSEARTIQGRRRRDKDAWVKALGG